MSEENGGYDWEGESRRQYRAEPVPAGDHTLQVKQIRHANKDGVPFLSQKNEEQMLLIYEDEKHRECAQMVTLSDAAGWTLAKLLGAAGADLPSMKAAGYAPKDFADPTFANDFLMPAGRGLSFRARVSHRDNPRDPKRPFTDVVPLRSLPKDDEEF